jgi:molybdate transport system substrate-binding protein
MARGLDCAAARTLRKWLFAGGAVGVHDSFVASRRRLALAAVAFGLLAVASARVRAETVEVFAAGSLRGVVDELAREAGPELGIEVKSSFGGSGLMRERIEKGESPDMLLSADLGSPGKLAAMHRTVVPVIAFARNRMCILSRRSAGVTARNLIDRLLDKRVRLKTSKPVADPSGDYAWAIIDRIDALRPGSGAILRDKAQASMDLAATPAPGQSAVTALFVSDQIDMSITYCSGVRALEQDAPDLASLEIPPQLDPHPLYGAAVLSKKPQALQLLLYLLSEKGQAIIARQGLVPLVEAGEGKNP